MSKLPILPEEFRRRQKVGKMKVWITESEWDEIDSITLGVGDSRFANIDLCRNCIRRLFPGILPKHGSDEKVWVELTARRVRE